MSLASRVVGKFADALALSTPVLPDSEQRIRTGASFFGGLPNNGRGALNYTTGGAKWRGGLSNTGASPVIDHALMRQNARTAYHESVHARSLVDRAADVIVDTGLKAEPDPNIGILGISPDQARGWSEDVGNRFHTWAKSKNVTRDGTQNFYQMQRLIEICQQRENDYFVRFFYGSNKRGLTNPLQLQAIDASCIDGCGFTSTDGFQYFEDGIKRDSGGLEKAYQVLVRGVDGTYKSKTIPARGAKSDRLLMLHGFVPEYPGQGRGFSRIGHAIQEFENLTDFTSAQIKKAILQSSINMVNKPSADKPASNPFEDIMSGRAGSDGFADFASVEAPETECNRICYTDLPEATIDVPGSVGVFNLQGGEDLQPFKSTAPSEGFGVFVEAFVSYLAASVSMPIEVLTMKFGESFSAARAALLLFWRVATIWRNELISDFLDPVYEAWLSGEIALGRVSAPGWSDPLLRQAWLNTNWYGVPMPNIDPMRTMEADRGYVEMGALDLDRLARDHNGSSGKLNRFKLGNQYAELKIPPWRQKDVSSDE